MKLFKTISITVIATLVAAVVGAVAFAWSGLYPVAASSRHAAPVGWLLATTRERSVERRASDLTVPADLNSSERIAAGAGHYKEMCVGCHGALDAEPASAFNPAPPALYRHRVKSRTAFWTIKHGLKMTAMPSHLDHSDAENWDIVAFIRALPDMTAAEYTRITEQATHEHADGHAHEREHGNASHEHADAAGDEPSHRHTDSEDAPATGGDDHHHGDAAATPEATVKAFHHALAEGRGDDALAYLHPSAVIAEAGRIETVEHYAGGHMAGDMQFLGQISIEPISRKVLAKSDTQAAISSRRRMRGQVRDQEMDVVSSETATLIKTDNGWRIVHLAWSSRPYAGG